MMQTGLQMTPFEWELKHQHYLDYLNRLNTAMIVLALTLAGISGWLLHWTASSSSESSHIFQGGQLLMAQVKKRDCARALGREADDASLARAQSVLLFSFSVLGLYASLRVKGDIAQFLLKDTKTPLAKKKQPVDTVGQNLLEM